MEEEEGLENPDKMFTPPVLDPLSVDYLQENLVILQKEMNRVKEEIKKKSLLKLEAESFFRKTWTWQKMKLWNLARYLFTLDSNQIAILGHEQSQFTKVHTTYLGTLIMPPPSSTLNGPVTYIRG